jgi:glycyl-tRNA synthetase (class II)
MLIKLEHPFIESEEKLNHPFSEIDKTKLAEAIESNAERIRSVMLSQEQTGEEWKPTVIELGKIGTRLFTLVIYHSDIDDDIPSSVKQLLPTISPIRVDVMTTLQAANDTNVTHMKAAQVYDDGDIHAKYIHDVLREDEGIRPMDQR